MLSQVELHLTQPERETLAVLTDTYPWVSKSGDGEGSLPSRLSYLRVRYDCAGRTGSPLRVSLTWGKVRQDEEHSFSGPVCLTYR